MAQTFILLNTTVLGTTTFPAGSSIDGNSDPIDQLRAAGAVLIPPAYAPPSLIAATERALQARSKGASYQALDQIMLSGLGARTSQLGGGSIFVYREGETNPGGNVFNNFEEAREAAIQSFPSGVFFDRSLGQPVIRSGTYDVNGVAFLGGPGATPGVILEDGVRFSGSSFQIDNVDLVTNSTSPIFEFVGGKTGRFVLNNGAGMETASPASGPMIHVDGTSNVFIFLHYFGFWFGYDPGAPILSVDLGGTAFIGTDIATVILDDVLDGAGAITVDDLTGIAVLNRNLDISHTQLGTNISYVYG